MAPDESPKRIYLVDGTSQLYRAFFAIHGLTNAEGLPTNAVYGFTTMLRKLINDESPPYLGVAFDTRGPVFRHDSFPEYKANRPPTPEDLRLQLPYAKQICEAFGIPVLEMAGFEADDLIATVTARAREDGFEVVVVASDKDLLQLVGEGVTVLNPSKNLRLDSAGVSETFGTPPELVVDALGLMGDSVDNVPGVPGVGRKTALGMVSTYGGIEPILDRAEKFVGVYDARDALVGAIDTAAKEPLLSEASASDVASAVAGLVENVEILLNVEKDDAFAQRLRDILNLVAGADASSVASRVGQPGRAALKLLAPLRRELKGLDRASSRRIWYAVAENREQALLSRQLVTLHMEAPVPFEPGEFERGSENTELMRGLFGSLGFGSLLAEIEAEGPAASPAPAVAHDVILTVDELSRFVELCRAAGGLAIGVEIDGADAMRCRLVGLAMACGDRAVYVPSGHQYLGAPDQLSLDAIRQTLGPLLADPEVRTVGHDLKRLAHVLRRHDLEFRGWSLDTMVAAFLLDASRSRYTLGGLARTYLGRDLAEDGDKKAEQVSEQEVERVATRAAGSAGIVDALAGVLGRKLQDTGLNELYDTIDGPLLPVLTDMEAMGIRVDTDLLERMSGEMEQGLERTRAEIHRSAGIEFNVDSPKQMREILFDRLQLKPRRKTAKKKAPSTDAQTLEELADEHEIAAKILEYRELSKLKNTYVDSLPRLVNPETGRVHTSYHPTGAATGRLSSSDPNLQNIPVRKEAGRKIRAAFVPAAGHMFLASDYSQIELRILAHMAEDPELIAAFRAGEDIHRHTAARVFDVHVDLVSDGMRRRAKAVNFGILYGMSESRLAREQGMTRTEARRFIDTYFSRFSRVKGYIEAVREQAVRDGEVRTLFGRVRPFPQLRQQVNRAVREQALRAAVNTTLQGTAADLMKLAMLAVARRLVEARSPSRILLQVHDELLLEVPEDSLENTGSLVRDAMEKVHPLAVPLVADQKVGTNWLEAT